MLKRSIVKENNPPTVYECGNLQGFKRFESPDMYVSNKFMQSEMTVLGWAIFFGGTNPEECVKILHHVMTLNSCNPLLPMKEGSFRGKTAKEIAKHFQRTNIVDLMETVENTFARKMYEKHEYQVGASRRMSLGGIGVSFKTVDDQTPKTSFGEDKKTTKLTRTTGADQTKDEYRKNTMEILSYLEQVQIPLDDQVEVCRTLMASEFCDIERIARAERHDLVNLGLNQPTTKSILSQRHTISYKKALPQAPSAIPTPIYPMKRTDVSETKCHDNIRKTLKASDSDEALLEPSSSLLKNTEALLEPSSSLLKNTEALLEPSSFLLKNTEALLEPASSLLKNEEALLEPASSLLKNEEALLEPSKIIGGWQRLPQGKRFHFYISYNWGRFQLGKIQIKSLIQLLRHNGYLVWVDEEQFEENLREDCKRGLNDSCVFIACLTSKYEDKVISKSFWNGTEFHEALDLKMPMVGLFFETFSTKLKSFSNTIDLSLSTLWESGLNELTSWTDERLRDGV